MNLYEQKGKREVSVKFKPGEFIKVVKYGTEIILHELFTTRTLKIDDTMHIQIIESDK